MDDMQETPVDADWRNLNLANWESRVPLHTGPDGYDLASFDDPGYLSPEVRYDLPRLGRLNGLDVAHLQCHIGTDTVSLSRLGSRSTAGLDFSPAALRAARGLATRAGANVEFVEGDVYDAAQALGAGRFDLVYTGIGALCWIPSISRWAGVVASLLRPGGRLFMREGHPVLWSLSDPRPDGLFVVEYPYFETEGIPFIEHDTYAGTGAVTSPRIIHFNHGLGEIFTALTDVGLVVTALQEHREVPWNPLGDAMMPSPDFAGEFILANGRDRIPMTYTMQAVKR
ncbi:Methyltransferase domain protein [Mycobacterium basiliense]|uniref:Methyltransferase domain protein n=1 Tax=Mycobacterium basiliense TaxID=2094119 RepID=A0A3S4BF27_9MYCO|nr:class I SAM-dependent methyltransferase [Mycobacterium basiliense]VDM89186.1 Methyltransferase domain protein [Mycobacterium basiliense]